MKRLKPVLDEFLHGTQTASFTSTQDEVFLNQPTSHDERLHGAQPILNSFVPFERFFLKEDGLQMNPHVSVLNTVAMSRVEFSGGLLHGRQPASAVELNPQLAR